jgi:hypothetical protein
MEEITTFNVQFSCSDFDGNYEFQQSKITIIKLCISEV